MSMYHAHLYNIDWMPTESKTMSIQLLYCYDDRSFVKFHNNAIFDVSKHSISWRQKYLPLAVLLSNDVNHDPLSGLHNSEASCNFISYWKLKVIQLNWIQWQIKLKVTEEQLTLREFIHCWVLNGIFNQSVTNLLLIFKVKVNNNLN